MLGLGLGLAEAAVRSKAGWWLGAAHRLDGVSPLAILSPASGKSMLGGRSANDNELVSRQGGIKYVIAADGSLQTVPANTLAYDWSNGVREMLFEGAATPGIRTSTNAGAASGSPGQFPTYWNTYNGGGLTRTITAGVTDKGFPCVDIRMAGVLTESSWTLYFEGTTAAGIAAVQGDTVTESLFLALVGGSFAGLEVRLELYERDSAGAGIIGSRSADIKGNVSGSPRRFSHTYTMARSDCAFAHPRLVFLSSVGTAIDFTIRVSLPQWEKAPAASSPVPTSGTIITRPTDIVPLWAGAGDATAWAYRASIPVLKGNQFLLGSLESSTYRPFLRASSVTPENLVMDGISNAAITVGTAVLPGNVGTLIGWGPSGRRGATNGGTHSETSVVITYPTSPMFIGQNTGLSASQIIRLRELVAWALPDRPAASAVVAQAKAWSA
ncbi:hypothetical protein KL86PLE_90753 [uncultured Pleomorphomonas sp.]|uniref:Uncharacterized protein n=1 Tax=uncultured Pleomorphomonas sp. TaxID=442121 RepID=A0A212LR67_9HYPH|nr:hypothetical protein [uncultured Pleomorphomonas sp.]SCM80007.1 hypothetical protein KL86PLE_90753 [uncultured Pleomorphomonas sp.]